MSYIGGIQYSVDNRTDNELSSCINRADAMEKIKADIMPMGYTGRVQANSSANYARNYYGQLPDMGVNTRDTSLLQGKGFKDDVIDGSSRATQSASRFNYALDRQINKRYVDVSGQFIPNNKLRVLPNRSCVMWSGGQPNGALPPPYTDPDLYKLSSSLMADSINSQYNPSDANSYMKYKATRPKLTRQDLMDASQQYAMARPQNLAVAPVAPAAAALLATFPSARAGGFTPRTQQLLDSARQRRAGLPVDTSSFLSQVGATGSSTSSSDIRSSSMPP
jgi:hypothetical protein